MNADEELRNHLLRLAGHRCRGKHPDQYQLLERVNRNNPDEPGPPCKECFVEIKREYEAKSAKIHGRELSDEEAAAVRERLGIP